MSSLDKNNNENGDFTTTLGNPTYNLLAKASLKAYPNPFTDYFEVEFPLGVSNNVSVSIYNLSGQELSNDIYAIVNSKILITAESMPQAIYFVKVSFENGITESFKIMKN